MCQTANATLIDTVVDEFVQQQKLFSAYDITREAKSRGATEYHGQMKGQVHARWGDLQTTGYTRSLVPTPTGDTWLYHPIHADIQPYIDSVNGNQSSTALPSPNTAPTPSLSVSAPTVATSGDVKNQSTDAEGRLPIYNDQMSTLGAAAGDKVNVYVDKGQSITLTLPTNNSSTPYAEYTVNADGRVRLSNKILAAYLPSVSGVYRVSTTKDNIIVKSA